MEKRECPSEDASVARPGVWVTTWTAAAGIAEDRSHHEKGRVAKMGWPVVLIIELGDSRGSKHKRPNANRVVAHEFR